MSDRQSVLIVGAGPTGLVMAHELARAGIQCRLIDKDAHRATQSRAIAIHSRTVESFELMGLAEGFLAGRRSASTASDVCGDRGQIAHVELRFARHPLSLRAGGAPGRNRAHPRRARRPIGGSGRAQHRARRADAAPRLGRVGETAPGRPDRGGRGRLGSRLRWDAQHGPRPAWRFVFRQHLSRAFRAGGYKRRRRPRP